MDSMFRKKRVLCLCAGLQSSGTTLISWCFLQRADMDGILDANNDMFADIPLALASRYVWVKTTIGGFRASEQIAYFQDLGWVVRPILICRDVREAYASLRTKRYGSNGTTAEDPPLRLRFRRFREDWELFQAKGWPILRFDQFLRDPENVLAQACANLEIPWDDAMLTWPKPKSAVFDTRHGNETFRHSCGETLWNSLKPTGKPPHQLIIPAGDHRWLESEFARYNQFNGYPAHLTGPADVDTDDFDIACYSVTRRVQWRQQQVPLQYLLHRVARWFTGESANDSRRKRSSLQNSGAPRQVAEPAQPASATIDCD
jgi:hypothetical protein